MPLRKSQRFKNKPRITYGQKSKEVKNVERKTQDDYKTIRKAPYAYSVPLATEQVFCRGIFYQIGDIVGLKDASDGQIYYAQLRGFLQDQYCEKSAVITWLLPSASSPETGFDPETYYLGPEEDTPRKLKHMEFICHSPSRFYCNTNCPLSALTLKPETGFIWTQEDDGVTCKIDECKKICSEVRFIKVNSDGEQLSPVEEEITIIDCNT